MQMDPAFADNLKLYLATLSREQRVELIDPTNYQFNVNQFPNDPSNPYKNNPNSSNAGGGTNLLPGQKKISKGYYVLEFTFFLIALAVYVGIYFVQLYVSNQVISHYYSNGYSITSSAIIGTSVVPQPSFTVVNVIKSIVYVWAMWKFANIIAVIDMLAHVVTWKKVVGFFSLFLLVCGIDSVLFILLNQYNMQAIFVGSAMLLSLLVSSLLYIGHEQKFHVTLRNAILPFLSYIFIAAIYWIVMPQLWKLSLKYLTFPLNYSAFFYVFPIIDTLLVLFNWMMQHFVSQQMKLFVSTANNWLLQGYRVGILLRINFTQVQFYYNVFWIIFRNIFFNFVIDKSKGDRMNASMIGWIFAFYASYVLNYIPINGIMNIITSYYYNTYVAVLPPYIFNWNPYTTYYSSITGMNIFFYGNIVWWTPLIIWVASVFTQKYHLFAFNWKLLFYSLFGIFMFYQGLVSGLFINQLASHALF